MPTLTLEVWSDIACPWCYVGKRRLEAALAGFEQRAAVEVVWLAFELDPAAPPERDPATSYAARLAQKYGTSIARAQEMIATMTATAKSEGLDFDFDRIRPGNTFDAHRVLHLARDRGLQDAVKERFLAGYLCEGEAIGQQEVLLRLGTQAGLDTDEISAVLAGSDYAREVRADQERAHRLGVQGVPFFVVGGRHALSGAQPASVLAQAIGLAWKDLEAVPELMAEGATCGPDGCA